MTVGAGWHHWAFVIHASMCLCRAAALLCTYRGEGGQLSVGEGDSAPPSAGPWEFLRLFPGKTFLPLRGGEYILAPGHFFKPPPVPFPSRGA